MSQVFILEEFFSSFDHKSPQILPAGSDRQRRSRGFDRVASAQRMVKPTEKKTFWRQWEKIPASREAEESRRNLCNTAFGHTSQVAKEVPSQLEANHDRLLFYRLKQCLLLDLLRVSGASNLADVWGST